MKTSHTIAFMASLVSMILFAVSSGNLILAIAPLAIVSLFFIFIISPLRLSASGLLFIALLCDNPDERPMDGKWKSPLYELGKLLFVNLHKTLGIDILRFSAIEGIFLIFVIIILIKKASQKDVFCGQSSSCLKTSLIVSAASIVLLEVWGLARGGDFKNSLWQLRQLFWLPIVTMVFSHCFKTRRDHHFLAGIILTVAILRAFEGFYFKYMIAIPRGYLVEYVTTHADTVLTVTSIMILVVALFEKPSIFMIALNLLLNPIYLFAIISNDRRIAFVSLGLCLIACCFLFRPLIQRRILIGLAFMSPLFVSYASVGWFSSAKIFKPVQTIKSVFNKEDASSGTRDIENYNLIFTAKQNPLIGQGFGHPYIEKVKAYQIDHIFKQYRFIAHNSILWLMSLGGAVGVAGWWMFMCVAVFLARRIYILAYSDTQRIISMVSICVIITYLVQAYGDMGFQSWMCTLLVGSTLGILGPLAITTGAWPKVLPERSPK